METDICDLLRAAAIGFEKIAEILDAFAEACEEIVAWVKDLFGEVEEQPSKSAPKKLRPNYKDKCKIRWLDVPNKVMQGRIRRFR